MKTYLVGGAVRDALLGLPVKDRDWVVVGATPEQMVAQGFKPVGKDFPVFLHPVTHEEYALARTERKTAPGYRGFVVHAASDVTLEEDLARRDITINSIAVDAIDTSTNGVIFSNDQLIDPFGGQNDLNHQVLRHVTDAFREDPVRILRVARFAARFSDFSVAPETLALMRQMAQNGEIDALVPERVWQELSAGLMENNPSRMLDVLAHSAALARLLAPAGQGQAFWTTPAPWALLDQAAQAGEPQPVRAALLMVLLQVKSGQLPRGLSRLPRDCSELAKLLERQFDRADASHQLDAAQWVQWLVACDAFRRPVRFLQFIRSCELLLGRALPGAGVLAAAQTARLPAVPPAGQTTTGLGPEIGLLLNQLRTRAISDFLG